MATSNTPYKDFLPGLPLHVRTHPRARRILVKLVPNKGLEVVLPKGTPLTLVPKVLAEKKTWVERTYAKMVAEGFTMRETTPKLPNKVVFPSVGLSFSVHFIPAQSARTTLTQNVDKLILKGTEDDALEALRAFTTGQAKTHLTDILQQTALNTGLEYTSCRIRAQRSRWGSCSAKKNISLNRNLLFLPRPLVDQLMLHELCHTVHMNHSAQYWRLVQSHQPDFLRLEDELKSARHHVPRWAC